MSTATAGSGPAMATESTDRDASAAGLMASQSALVVAGLLFGGYGLGTDFLEGRTADAPERDRTAAAPDDVEELTAA